MTVALACLIYAAAMVSANLSVATFGPWISPLNAFLLIGLDLTLRDRLHDAWRGRRLWPRMLALILVSAVVSWALNPAAGRIAAASFAAFVVAGLVDALVYHRLQRSVRWGGYLQRVNGSNIAGAAADSLLFPTLAFGSFMPSIVLLQFAAKLGGGFLWSLLLRPRRVVEA